METRIADCVSELKAVCKKVKGERRLVETEPQLSAGVFHELGKLYQSGVDEDVYNYIHSVGLFVASRIRRPSEEVEKSISELWQTLLVRAEAVHRMFDLDEITSRIKERIHDLRQTASRSISSIREVDSDSEWDERRKTQTVFKISSNVSNQFLWIMDEVSDICVEIVFGNQKRGSSFALCALGSVARGEATPYSDFEHMILLEDGLSNEEEECMRDKMRWYTLIFQFIIVNLGETPLRLLGIPCLNNFYTSDESEDWFYDAFTPCGICFDSNMPYASIHPLSRRETAKKQFRTELIQSVSKMVAYLKDDTVLINGYHLGTVLAKSKFVSGKKALHEQYRKLVDNELSGQIKVILSNIKACMDKENVLFEMKNKNNSRNIKKICYRGSSVIIGHLGSLFNVPASNSFRIVEQLVNNGHLNEKAGNNLKYIIALSWEVRLRFYLNAKQQVAEISTFADDPVAELAKCIGKKSLFTFCTIWFSFWTVLQPVVLSLEDLSSISKSDMRLTDRSTTELWTAYLCPEKLDMKRKVDTIFDDKQDLRSALIGQVATVCLAELYQAVEDLVLEFDGDSGHQQYTLEWAMHKVNLLSSWLASLENKMKHPVKLSEKHLTAKDLSILIFGKAYYSQCLLRFHHLFYKCINLVYPYAPALCDLGSSFIILLYRFGDIADSINDLFQSFATAELDDIMITCNALWNRLNEIKRKLFFPKLSPFVSLVFHFAKHVVRPDLFRVSLNAIRKRFEFLHNKLLPSYHNKILNNGFSTNKAMMKFSLLRDVPYDVLVHQFVDKFSRSLSFIQADIKHCQALHMYKARRFEECRAYIREALMCIGDECADSVADDLRQLRKIFRLLGVCAFREKRYRLARDAFNGDTALSDHPFTVLRSLLKKINT